MQGLTRRNVFLAGAGLAAARAAQAQTPAPASVLRIGLVNYPPNIRPFEATGSSQIAVKQMLHRGLLSYDPAGNLVTELAESWTPEGSTGHLFRLRDGARFHDGTKVTSEDVRWSIEQILKPTGTAYLRPDFAVLDRIETVDARSVRFVLKQPSAPFPHLLANYHAPILSAKINDPYSNVGCGPYRLVSQERGVAIEVARVDGFYKPGKPKTPAIRYLAYGDENLRAAALEAGDVEIIEGVPWQNMDAMERNKRLKLDATDGPFMYLIFNAKTGPFTDARVRRAAGYAIKREEIVKTAMYGRGEPLFGLPYPPGTPFAGRPAGEAFRYDPDFARKLLAEAGMGGGVTAKLLATTSPTLHQQTAEVVQQHLAAVGIQVELVLPEWSTRVAMGNRGQYDFAVMGSVGNWPDPDSLSSYLATAPGAYQRSYLFSSPRVDGLLDAGRRELDPAKRLLVYDDLQRANEAEASFVPLALRSQAYGMQQRVQGFRNMPGFLTFYSPITLEDAVA